MNDNFLLSKDQIQKLFDFTRKKYVKYEDVRIELVDHLASDIEDQVTADPKLSFDTALKNSYRKFPITGFTEFTAAKESGLRRHWMRKILSLFISYFTLPRILLTSIIALFFYVACLIFPEVAIHKVLVVLLYGGLAIYYVAELLGLKERKLTDSGALWKKGEKYLFINIYVSLISSGGTGAIFLLYFIVDRPTMSGIGLYLYIGLLSLMTIYTIALVSGQFSELLVKEMRTKYQHLNLELEDFELA